MHKARSHCLFRAGNFRLTGFFLLLLPALAMADDWTFYGPVMKRYLVELKAEDGLPTATVQCTSVGTQTNEMSVVATLQTLGALDLPVSR